MHKNEDKLRNREADEAWMHYQRTGQFVSNNDMTAWLNTWGSDLEIESLRRLWNEGLASGSSCFASMTDLRAEARRRLRDNPP